MRIPKLYFKGGRVGWTGKSKIIMIHCTTEKKRVLVPYTWEGGPVLKTRMSSFLVLMSQEGRLFPPNWTPLATWNIIWETSLMPYPSHMLCPGPKCHFPPTLMSLPVLVASTHTPLLPDTQL